MNNSPLGKKVAIPTVYAPQVLHSIPRREGRERLKEGGSLPDEVYGMDYWHAWELSWLSSTGKPQVAVGELFFPMDSPNIIESKSLKLYLNSLCNEVFENWKDLRQVISQDLSQVSGAEVDVVLNELAPAQAPSKNLLPLLSQKDAIPMRNLDTIDLGDKNSKGSKNSKKHSAELEPQPELLKVAPTSEETQAILCSDLFRSNCPVTGQPDWASVEIRYRGWRLDEAALLRYLLSYREYRAFHEECAERIFRDLYRACEPEFLWLGLNFLRRGGLDINIYRSTEPMEVQNLRRRMLRQ